MAGDRKTPMPTYQASSVIPVDFETVWDFYDSAEGLERLTPAWLGLRVRRIVGPDGEPDPPEYLVGTEIHLELEPFGPSALPAIGWVAEITDREVADGRASFVDEQVDGRGPFETWRHAHRFVDLGDETLVVDRVTYRLPHAGELPLATPGLAVLFWYRHRRTRTILSGVDGQ